MYDTDPFSEEAPTLMKRLAAHKVLLSAAVAVLLAGTGGGAYYMLRGHASPETRMANARNLERVGDHKGAAIELKNALQMAPGNAEARALLGRIYYANNDFANAEKELRKALSQRQPSAETSVLLARTLLMLRQPQKLLDDVKPLPGAPGEANATILALRGQAQSQLGNQEGMTESLRQADLLVAEHPDTLAVRAGLAYTQGHPEEALALVEKALTKGAKRTDLLVMRGELLRAQKRDDDAIVAFGQALASDPGNIQARLAVAQLYLVKSNLDKAQAELKTLQGQAPNNLMARYLDGLIEFRRNHIEAASSRLQEVLRSAPDFAPANFLVGAIALSQGKRENAISALNRVLEVAPNHGLARKLLASAMLESGQVDQAQKVIAEMKNDSGDAQLLALQGGIALSKGDYLDARKKLEQASTLAPKDQRVIRELAASRMASGDEPGTIEALGRLATLDTTTHQADALLVMTLVKDKRYDDALKAIDELDRKAPKLALASNLRGVVFMARNDPKQARGHFAHALELDAGYFPAASNLARLDLADKDIKAARGRYQTVLKQNPKNSRALTALAGLASLEKNEPEFLSLLGQAMKADPTDANARQMIVHYWLDKRDAGKALVEARAALTATGRPEFLDSMGAAQLLQNDMANALVSYGKWAQLSPNNPYAHFRLAQAQSISQDDQRALKSLDKALSLRPGFAEASLSKALLLAKTGNAADGIKIARMLQSRDPGQAIGYLAEADIQFAGKNFLDSARLFAKAAQLAGQGPSLARAYQAYVAAGKTAEGERLLESWLKAHPDDRVVRHVQAQAQLNGGRMREAAANYRILIRADPADLVAYNNLAWLLGELKDPQALAISEQAYKLAPKNGSVLDTYGWQLNLAGQPARALPLLREALKSRPDSSEMRWHLAATLAQSGNKSEAGTELDRLLTSQAAFPQRAEAQTLLAQLRGK